MSCPFESCVCMFFFCLHVASKISYSLRPSKVFFCTLNLKQVTTLRQSNVFSWTLNVKQVTHWDSRKLSLARWTWNKLLTETAERFLLNVERETSYSLRQPNGFSWTLNAKQVTHWDRRTFSLERWTQNKLLRPSNVFSWTLNGECQFRMCATSVSWPPARRQIAPPT